MNMDNIQGGLWSIPGSILKTFFHSPRTFRQSFISWLLRTLGLKQGGPRADFLSSSRFHRIIRRGRPFGALIDREEAVKGEEPGFESGIYFIALNANISRQFEFIQNAWIVSS